MSATKTYERSHRAEATPLRQPKTEMSRSEPARNPLPAWKRGLDLFCLIALSPALIPVMGLTALIVRLSSRGPILFRQERVGLYGRTFTCFKFRTMRVSAETQSHQAYLESLMVNGKPMEKLDLKDQRIIPGGLFLRASGLDELPQIFNIIKGEMSFVGPRPCVPYEYKKFRPEHRARFDAVPGLTGLWQVSGKNSTTFQQMIDMDIDYSRRLSLRHDFVILVLTFPVLFKQVFEMIRKKRTHRRKR
jgi:lipopolysaccharide/colanic/teichoic acid biosynthesis glycosyltransferase